MSSASSPTLWRSAPVSEAPEGLTRRALFPAVATIVTASLGTARAETPRLGFGDLYKSFGVLGLEFSDRLLALRGQSVVMRGFMAPPLRAESTFFVLTREPMSLCPFCSSDADWPVDIVVVNLRRQGTPTNPNDRIEVTGRLEVGSAVDPESGFVSMIRLVDADFRRS